MTPKTLHIDTIAAIATPKGQGGIGIIKLSGPDVRRIRNTLFRPSRKDQSDQSHRLIHGMILDPKESRPVDEVLVSFMTAPRSYTGEDVVEINTHGGTVILRRILALCIENGARMAEPGEFTKRGFLNGRIDLTQAEAVIDVIEAKTARAAVMASRSLTGEFRLRAEKMLTALRDVYAHIAASIDFPEEMESEEEAHQPLIQQLTENVKAPIEKLLKHQAVGEILRGGARIAVVGRPNVGKSSLMNRLLDKERVIVSELPGTTRDAVVDITSIEGIPVTLIDTAGIRETTDPLEAMGMQKTREALEGAHLVLFLVESGNPFQKDDLVILESLSGVRFILVRNKMDLTKKHHQPTAISLGRDVPEVTISAKFGYELERLKTMMAAQLTQGSGSDDTDDIMPNARQSVHLTEAANAVGRSIDLLARGGEDELVAMELDSAVESINMLLGISAPPEILDTVFSRFCIGK